MTFFNLPLNCELYCTPPTGFSSGTCLLYKDYHPDQTLADAEDVISPPIVTREELDTMIENGDDVTYINTSQITDMSDLFYNNSSFNQDISGWDVSNVTRMSRMFFSATSFNQDISNWDVSSVTRMEYMFYRAEVFNQDLSNWDVDNVNYNFHSEFATYSDLSSENYPDWK